MGVWPRGVGRIYCSPPRVKRRTDSTAVHGSVCDVPSHTSVAQSGES